MKCHICGKDKPDVTLVSITKDCYEKIKHMLQDSVEQPEDPSERFGDMHVMVCKGCQDSL